MFHVAIDIATTAKIGGVFTLPRRGDLRADIG